MAGDHNIYAQINQSWQNTQDIIQIRFLIWFERPCLAITRYYSPPIFLFETMLVTGGYHTSGYLTSTELLVETASAWVYAGELPSIRSGLRGIKIDNKILMTGNGKTQSHT